jgi:hypothetical protein
MLLSARLLSGVTDVNTFEVVTTLEMTQGDQQDVYFQLIDASVQKFASPKGRRYIPPSGASLRVTVQSLDSNQTLVGSATQPFSGDLSIWKFRWPLPPYQNADYDPDSVVGTFALKLVLTEPGTTLPAAWSDATTYDVDELVSVDDNQLWRSLQADNLNNTPGADDIWWEQMNITPTRTLTAFVSQALNIALAAAEF